MTFRSEMMEESFLEVTKCRICGNPDLEPVLSLGIQSLTGVFPKSRADRITAGPLELVKCTEDGQGTTCGLLQLRHSYRLEEMYGLNYGYRSGLNITMVRHLDFLARKATAIAQVSPGDIILDIGSNDGTLLRCYPVSDVQLFGIDPTAEKFRAYYPHEAHVVADFFSAETFRKEVGSKKAKIVTSILTFRAFW